MSNITYEGFVLSNVGQAISITLQYQYAPPTNASATPVFRDIAILDYVSDNTVGSAGEFLCLPESPCYNMTLVDVAVNGAQEYQCEDAYGTMSSVDPIACLLPEP